MSDPIAPTGESEMASLECAFRTFGGRWKSRILNELLAGPRRFGELKSAIARITQAVLVSHLRELEREGVLNRTTVAEAPPKVVYSLTPHGQSVAPVIRSLIDWGRSQLARSQGTSENGERH